jgi:hypothetical protein
MATERRRQLVLAVLAVVLAIVVYRAWPTTSPSPARSSNQKASGRSVAATSGTGRSSAPAIEATDVHLEALEAERPKPGPHERNLFRFREKRPPPPTRPDATPPTVVPTPPEPPGQPPPPSVPPINLKFLGTVKGQGEGKPKIAILSDGNGPPLYGKEGELVAGRYRILKIGEESIELAYADGRGRQTIRLTGM